jgi:hypothetical protein
MKPDELVGQLKKDQYIRELIHVWADLCDGNEREGKIVKEFEKKVRTYKSSVVVHSRITSLSNFE